MIAEFEEATRAHVTMIQSDRMTNFWYLRGPIRAKLQIIEQRINLRISETSDVIKDNTDEDGIFTIPTELTE